MREHDDMGKRGINITYEDVKRAADANGMTVEESLAMITQPSDKDRTDHLLSGAPSIISFPRSTALRRR